jgi:hypothetical protein
MIGEEEGGGGEGAAAVAHVNNRGTSDLGISEFNQYSR